jgi:hypothetical protein
MVVCICVVLLWVVSSYTIYEFLRTIIGERWWDIIFCSVAAEFQYTPTRDQYNFATAQGTGCKTEVGIAIMIIKRTVKELIDLGLFSLRSGCAKYILISTQHAN